MCIKYVVYLLETQIFIPELSTSGTHWVQGDILYNLTELWIKLIQFK